MEPLHYRSLAALGRALRARDLSSLEVTRHLLARIDALEPILHSYVTVLDAPALAQARHADDDFARGVDRGPLQGVPVAVKDLFYTANAPTSAGSTVLGDVLPRWNATVIDRLDGGGAVLLGKLATAEGALSEHRCDRPAPVNPWHADYWTGVSSSGSGVATAAGLCYASIGTDTGGSIRMPSMACGLSGLKPTWGRVSRHGLFPLCESRDHVGPMARSVADAAALLSVIAGPDPKDPTSLPAPPEDYQRGLDDGLQGLRVGVDWAALTEGVDPAITAALRQAARTFTTQGAALKEISLPSPMDYLQIYFAATAAEVALAHAPYFPEHGHAYGAVLRRIVVAGPAVSGLDVVKVEHAKLHYGATLAALFQDIDVLLLPVLAAPTQTVAEMAALQDPAHFILTQGRFTIPFNATGNPALVVPCGVAANGLPLALQLVGRPLEEATLLRAGQAFQRTTDWHLRRPPLA